MSYIWEDPEVFMIHNGVTIYHVYRDDFVANGKMSNIYGIASCCSIENDEYVFDVRELPNYIGGKAHLTIIAEAINQGWITEDEMKFPRSMQVL